MWPVSEQIVRIAMSDLKAVLINKQKAVDIYVITHDKRCFLLKSLA
jgi:hypothetical protein